MKTRNAVLGIVAAVALSLSAASAGGAGTAGVGLHFVAAGAPTQAGAAILSVTNGLPNEAGGYNPLAGAPLALLRESFESLLRKTRLFEGQPSPLRAWNDACLKKSPLCRQPMDAVQEAVVAEGQMAPSGGGATFPGVPAGTYYLFAYRFSIQERQVLVWDVRVELKPGANPVTLDRRNVTPLDLQTRRDAPPSAAPPGGGVRSAAPADVPAAPARPGGPKNSVLGLRAISAPREPIGRTFFYLLDDDFEGALRRAGFRPQMLLGKELPLLNSFELVWRWKTMKETNPAFALLEGLAGGSALPPGVEEQYAVGMKVLSEHTVATAKTDINGRASFPAVPAGTYYVYGTANQFVKTGATGTVSGNTVTLNDTGYQAATIWNLKVVVRPGQNAVTLTPDNAAFAGN
jgi:hypothetical protein